MELTGLKSFKNAGGNVYSSIGSSDSSKTVGYKQINNAGNDINLPKFDDGTPGQQQSSTSSSTSNTSLADNYGGWGNQQFNNSVTTQSFNPGLNVPYSGKVDTSGITPNAYALTKYGTNSVKSYFNSPAATAGANITAKVGPSSTGGKGVNWSGIGNVVTSGVQFAGDAINSFSVNETGEDVQQKYGTSQQNVGGIGYESQNMIDLNKEMDRVKSENTGNTLKTVGSGAALGAAAGSIIPGLGTIAGGLIGAGVGLITGIFGGEARKREYRRLLAKQNSKINALQDSARFSAQTKAIQQINAREYGNSEAQYLYGAKEGKQPEVDPKTMLSKDKLLSITPNGYTIDNADSMVEPGETLFNTETGSMTQVPRLASGKLHPGDIQPAKIGNAAVFTDRHKDPITGKSFAQAAIDGDDDPYNLLYRQKVLVNDKKDNKGLMKAKNGKLPKFEEGLTPWQIMQKNIKTASKSDIDRWKNTITEPIYSTFGGYTDPYSLNKKLVPPAAENNSYKRPNTRNGKWYTSWLDDLPYYSNMATSLANELFRDHTKYRPTTNTKNRNDYALDVLAGLRMNPYPMYIANRNAESRTKGGINALGLQAPIKTLAFLAAQHNTQSNIGKSLANYQMQDNAYLSDYAKTSYAGGAADREFAANAKWHDDDVYMKSNANDIAWTLQNLSTASKAWQQANKNRFNRNTYRWMMDQYAQDALA